MTRTPLRTRTLSPAIVLALTLVAAGPSVRAQIAHTVALDAERLAVFADTVRAEEFLGRESLFLRRGLVIVEDVVLLNGAVEVDMAAGPGSLFMGLMFRTQSKDEFELVFLRPGQSGSLEAVQYNPTFMGGAAWQLFHGEGGNGRADIPRLEWIRLRVELAGLVARVFVGGASEPVVTIPNLALGDKHGQIGLWTGSFGNGAHFSNLRYTVDEGTYTSTPPSELLPGTLAEWELSEALDASTFDYGRLPDLSALTWERVSAEPPGRVVINRYRQGPNAFPSGTADSVAAGYAPGAKVVFARAVIDSEHEEYRRMDFGYSDAVTIYANGQPLFFGTNPIPFGDGVMEMTTGEAVFLPLRKGRNEVVFAVTEFFGGWGFWARIER